MAEIQVFKTKITNACTLLRSNEPEVMQFNQRFAFPLQIEECKAYVREKTALLNHLARSINAAKQFHDACVKEAIETINGRQEHKEREKLMLDLNKHLEADSNILETSVIQWLNKIDFRKEELLQQDSLITSSQHNHAVASSHSSCQEWSNGTMAPQERNVRVRRPLLEVPTFAGSYMEFNAFWSVFQSLIHSDDDLSGQEKFLFLKQALKGKAAASISSVPVVGEKYAVAINILKKHFDKSSSIADILINEIERLPRAQGNPRSCRETLAAISSRITHLEQTGLQMNADRMWRRLILSKFTESICSKVISKENDTGNAFNVNEIMDSIDEIITLKETTELTTRTLFGAEQTKQSNFKVHQDRFISSRVLSIHRNKPTCLCGETHLPQQCSKFSSPEERRAEARRQRVCWRCFNKGHNSRQCLVVSKCPKCNEDHHSSLCTSNGSRSQPANTLSRTQYPSSIASSQTALISTTLANHSSSKHLPRSHNQQQESGLERAFPTTASQRNIETERNQPASGQHVPQIASAQIFDEYQMDYRTVTLLLDSRARRSFIKSSFAASLKLPSHCATSSTAAGMGKLRKTSQSDEIRITLKSYRGSKKLKHVSVSTEVTFMAPTRTAKLSKVDRSFITKKKIPIAQRSLLSANVSPDILIGQDLLHRILDHNSAAIKLPSGLVLTPTIFGYTISGTGSKLNSMKPVRDVQCGSLIVATPLISSNDYSKTDKNTSGAEALFAHIQEPASIRPFAAKVRQKRGKKKEPISPPRTTLRPLLVLQDDEGVFPSKNARDTFYALLNSVKDIKRKLNGMEDRLRGLDERMHTLDLRTQKVTQTKVLRPSASQCPTVPTTRCCYMSGYQATEGQIRSAILQASTERVAQRPINRLINLEIHSSSHDQNDESPTYRARATALRKPSSPSRRKAYAPMSRRTPRVPLNTGVPS
uniref:CCHC-type domain-containing protein n=1 Tax=Haemonchus contortus TaxID=6289 RepID=A0A7I4YG10_HAECO